MSDGTSAIWLLGHLLVFGGILVGMTIDIVEIVFRRACCVAARNANDLSRLGENTTKNTMWLFHAIDGARRHLVANALDTPRTRYDHTTIKLASHWEHDDMVHACSYWNFKKITIASASKLNKKNAYNATLTSTTCALV